MGLNAYLEAVGGVGYTAGTTALGAWVAIDGKPGKRLAIQSLGLNPRLGGTAVAYLQMGLQNSSVSSGASGVTTVTSVAFTTAPVTGATVVVVLDNGTYQWLTVASTASTTSIPISSALTDDASGAIYDLGLYSTTGNAQIQCANTNTEKQSYGAPGLFFGKVKGSPARVGIIATLASLSSTVDYVTYGYINV
jgi:hypothetical protein